MSPTLRLERQLLAACGGRVIVGVDEVGRGALAGPVSVGVVALDPRGATVPTGLRDSKQLTPARRRALVPMLREWALASAVGHAQACEIDRWGIVAALRLAGRRALGRLQVQVDAILLDGCHDWLSVPQTLLAPAAGHPDLDPRLAKVAPVHVQVKADDACACVAAASVLAKVERDALMANLPDPGYCWARNKGYGSAAHLAALRRLGPSNQHRRSWKLPAREEPLGE